LWFKLLGFPYPRLSVLIRGKFLPFPIPAVPRDVDGHGDLPMLRQTTCYVNNIY